MRRRTLLQSALAVVATLPIPRMRAWAQGIGFPGLREETLQTLAATVLPESLGRARTNAVALEFAEWVAGYREGAELSPGYGSPRVRYTGPSPAVTYDRQLQALASGPLAHSELSARRRALADELRRAGIEDLTSIPRGAHVVADLMSFWFTSSTAHDLAYQAAIGKDRCRTIANSAARPAHLAPR